MGIMRLFTDDDQNMMMYAKRSQKKISVTQFRLTGFVNLDKYVYTIDVCVFIQPACQPTSY